MDIKKNHIGDIVANDFRTAAIFKKNGIDFCCKGGRTIEDACSNKNLNPETIYRAIEELPGQNSGTIDFNLFPLDLLADYVEKTHHRYAEEKIPIIMTFLEKLARVHGERHPELVEIRNLFAASVQDLSVHLKKEELILFPFIRNMVKAKINQEELLAPAFGTVENPVAMMMDDHSIEGDRFAKIAELTSNYNPPADACNTYRVTFAMLKEFEEDLHTHIHIENNILFPKAIRLEQELVVPA